MQYRVMKLDRSAYHTCDTSYFKQIPVLVSEIFKYMLKFKNIFKSILTYKCDLDLKPAQR